MTVITKTTCMQRGKRFLVVTAELRTDDSSGPSAGFSITGALYEPHGTWDGAARYRNSCEPDVVGRIHNEILAMMPRLAPLVTVHLADPAGIPMHAVSNGWYWYSGKGRKYEEERNYGVTKGKTDIELAAGALHIPVDDVPEGLDHDGFVAFAESLRPRWAEQARAARELLESL